MKCSWRSWQKGGYVKHPFTLWWLSWAKTDRCEDITWMIAFATQFETGTCIPKALKVFREWNTDFCPKYSMVDYSKAKRNALSECPLESKLVLCDFHREQASNQ